MGKRVNKQRCTGKVESTRLKAIYKLIKTFRQIKIYSYISWLMLIGSAPNAMSEPVVVKVGAYEFPPYFMLSTTATVSSAPLGRTGATIDLVAAINRLQDDYYLEIFLTSPKRSERSFDLMMNMTTYSWPFFA